MKSIRYFAVVIAAFALGFAVAHVSGGASAKAQTQAGAEDLGSYLERDAGPDGTRFTLTKDGQAFIILSSGEESPSGERGEIKVKQKSTVLTTPKGGFVVVGPLQQFWRTGPEKQCPIHPAGGPINDCPFPPGPFYEMTFLVGGPPTTSQ